MEVDKISSTNRSNSRDAHIADYYITPVEEITNFLEALEKDIGLSSCEFWNRKNAVLDPCAGGDAEHDMSYPTAIEEFRKRHALPAITTRTIDIRADSLAELKTDYLTYTLDYRPSLIITNPPFGEALPIIKKALSDTAENGIVAMLLRLNFLEGQNRKPFWENNMPSYVYVHHKRMSFTGGGTDSVAYCHMVWIKGNDTDTTLRII